MGCAGSTIPRPPPDSIRRQETECFRLADVRRYHGGLQLEEQFMTEVSHRKRFGVVADDKQRAMSGLEFVQGLVDGTLPLNSMAQTLGYDIVEVSKGRVVAAAEPPCGAPQPRRHRAWRPCRSPARQLHGTRHPLHAGQGFCANNARVQDFAGPTCHAGDRAGEGRRQSDQLRAPYRYGRGNVNGQRWTRSRARHDNVLALRALTHSASRCRASAPVNP